MYCTKLFKKKKVCFQKQWGWGLTDSQGTETRDRETSLIFDGQRSFKWGCGGLLLIHVVPISVTDMLLPCYNHITFMHFMRLLHFSEKTSQM